MLKDNTNRIQVILLGICIVLALVLSVTIIVRTAAQKEAEATYEEMRQSMEASDTTRESNKEDSNKEVSYQEDSSGESGTAEAGSESKLEDAKMLVRPDFAQYQEQNTDIYAWLSIPDTNIDYPVLQHESDNLYYLEHNLDGSAGLPGCVYSEKENSKEFTDFHTILYGHNMRNGTMFHDLRYFVEEEYFAQHPYIYVYTEAATFKYQVIAAYEYSDTHLLYAFRYDVPEGRQQYLDEIAAYDVLGEDPELSTESKILTLSTCVSGKDDRRLLVQGVLIETKEVE